MSLTRAEKVRLIELHRELSRRQARRRLSSYMPYPKQVEFHANGATERERLLMAGNQLGKLQHYQDLTLTPAGWVEIGQLSVGDEIIAGDGSITTVTGVFPQGVMPLVEMEFADGQKVLAGAEHLWLTLPPSGRFQTVWQSAPRVKGQKRGGQCVPNPDFDQWKVLTTAEMREAYGDDPKPKYRYATPAPGAVQFRPVPVPLDPYWVGIMLGDGGLTKHIGFTSADDQMRQAFACEVERMGGQVRYSPPYQMDAVYCKELRSVLNDLGMNGKGAGDKSVPPSYLWNSPDVRLAVLQGLMDTDGTCEKSGITTFTSISRQLADDVVFLVRSFGGRCRMRDRITSYTHNGERRQGRRSYTVTIRCPQVDLFRLQRKLDRYIRPTSTTDHNLVVAYRDAGEAPAVCISVAHPSRTYVTRDFIVTHNTWSAAFECAMHLTGQYPKAGERFYPTETQLADMDDQKLAAALFENLAAENLLGRDIYPDGWPGKRWDRPIWMWASSVSGEATRDNPQRLLVGDPAIEDKWGTGTLPYDSIMRRDGKFDVDRASQPTHALDAVRVQHVSGGTSLCQFKSYTQGRERWQGPTLDLVWFDEEPPSDIYYEGLTRTNARPGITMITFTPLRGLSDVVRLFISDDDGLLMD
jgi:phage terminase large subunit-like protein